MIDGRVTSLAAGLHVGSHFESSVTLYHYPNLPAGIHHDLSGHVPEDGGQPANEERIQRSCSADLTFSE